MLFSMVLAFTEDTHIIVAAAGLGSGLGPVMGPERAHYNPIAVSNPVFVRLNGLIFVHNGDTLGKDLPISMAAHGKIDANGEGFARIIAGTDEMESD